MQSGESLASIAQNYYGSEKLASYLLESNPQVRDPHRLAIGTVLQIPSQPPTQPTTAVDRSATTADPGKSLPRTYRVQPGDSFYSISKSVLGDASRWKELMALNKSTVNNDATQLQIGQVLKLPER